MSGRARFITAARTLVDVPFSQQGRDPMVGLDCIGVLTAAAEIAGFDLGYDFTGYGSAGSFDVLAFHLSQGLERVEGMGAIPGDVICIRLGSAGHLAIMTGPDSVVHTREKYGRVVECPIPRWFCGKVDSLWVVPGMVAWQPS